MNFYCISLFFSCLLCAADNNFSEVEMFFQFIAFNIFYVFVFVQRNVHNAVVAAVVSDNKFY